MQFQYNPEWFEDSEDEGDDWDLSKYRRDNDDDGSDDERSVDEAADGVNGMSINGDEPPEGATSVDGSDG